MTICPVPAAGIFETLLVSDGRPVELDAHLARLEASLGIVFGAPLPRGSGRLVCEHAAGVGHGRLRVTVGPAGIAVRVTEVPVEALFPGWERALWLRPLTVQGGIGAHKWADRTLLEAAEGRAGAGELPLVMDGDGTVLEASRGNVFLVADGTLVTPRADGRLLPGITRRRVLALAEDAGVEVREDVVTLAELLAADEVFLTGAVRGIEHVCGCDGGARWHTGPTASLLAERLQRLWNGIPERGDAMTVTDASELQFVIVMHGEATDDHVEDVLERLSAAGAHGRVAPGRDTTLIGAIGERGLLGSVALEERPGVEKVLPVSKPYKLVSLETSPDPTVIQVRGRRVGGGAFALIAGPCTVESREQTLATAEAVHAAGATMLRGGAFKPRTSPYSFRGLGDAALAILEEAREETGLPIVTELLDPRHMEAVARTADVIQIGARNMQNYLLLAEVGRGDTPVLLKRGPSASIDELLMAAEYILKEGNPRVILCERGIRTFEHSTRYTLDVAAVPVLKEETHLPVLVDPSHAAGRRELVPALARAAVAAGADGLLVEVHPDPERALCDAPQLLPTAEFGAFADELRVLAGLMGKEFG